MIWAPVDRQVERRGVMVWRSPMWHLFVDGCGACQAPDAKTLDGPMVCPQRQERPPAGEPVCPACNDAEVKLVIGKALLERMAEADMLGYEELT